MDPLSYYKNNTVNSRALIKTAIRYGVRHFIFSSTAAVYGSPAQIAVTEDAPTAPTSPYGWSKLMTEIMCADCGAHWSRDWTIDHLALDGAQGGRLTNGLSRLHADRGDNPDPGIQCYIEKIVDEQHAIRQRAHLVGHCEAIDNE
jgi:hypothetical protein